MTFTTPLTTLLLLVALLVPAALTAPAAVAADAPADRLGLHVTSGELAEWRTRATEGPYRTAGDVSSGSPGDWDRITARAATFMTDPDANRWAGPGDASGCVDAVLSTEYDPKDVNSRHVRDAAFAALVTSDADMRAAVAAELYAQSQVPNLDFSDRSRWCLETIWDINPGFEIANFLTSLLYAVEYVEIGDREAGTTSFGAGQQQAIVDWLYAAAEWMNHDNQVKLNSNFTDRTVLAEPPYTVTSSRESNPAINAAPYDGTGDVIGAIARFYNNRRAQQQRFVGLVGLHLLHRADGYRPALGSLGFTAEDLVADTDRFAKDYLVYSVYPQGFAGEFHRWKTTLPDLGWSYTVGVVAPVLTYVDAAARAGDTSLYDYTTSAGAHNTAGTPVGEVGKNYRWLVTNVLGYQDATHDRYIPGYAGQAAYRIDAVNTATGWYGVHEVAFAPVLRYWDDTYHQGVLDRSGSGTSPYPSKPAGFGQYVPWTGDWGTLPGALFMSSRMGHVASPYTTSEDTTTSEPVDAAPTVTITAPSDGTDVASGSAIEFSGSADDPEDGDVSSAISWSSDLDGPLGTGATIATVLAEGSHTVTAAVVDTAGNTASTSVVVTVSATTAPTAHVGSVTATGEGGKASNLHLLTGARLVDGAGVGLGGATVVLTVTRNSVLYGTWTGVTATDGSVSAKWTKVPKGQYAVTVSAVTTGSHLWDGTSPVATWSK